MNWLFINKPVETMLGVKRADMMGKHCSNWGAGICKTDNCGIECLRAGKPRTFFEQQNMNFQVDIAYIKDPKGKGWVTSRSSRTSPFRHENALTVTNGSPSIRPI